MLIFFLYLADNLTLGFYFRVRRWKMMMNHSFLSLNLSLPLFYHHNSFFCLLSILSAPFIFFLNKFNFRQQQQQQQNSNELVTFIQDWIIKMIQDDDDDDENEQQKWARPITSLSWFLFFLVQNFSLSISLSLLLVPCETFACQFQPNTHILYRLFQWLILRNFIYCSIRIREFILEILLQNKWAKIFIFFFFFFIFFIMNPMMWIYKLEHNPFIRSCFLV